MTCDYPVFLDLANRLAVVVGGGNVAVRKVDKLLSAGARVRVVAPELSERLAQLARFTAASDGEGEDHAAPRVTLIRRTFEPDDLDGALLAFACTNDAAVNAAVGEAARARRVLVNIADDPERCDFFVPAVSEHGQVKVAISTGGGSPAMAKCLRQWVDEHLPRGVDDLAREVARVRPVILQRVAGEAERATLWRRLCSDDSFGLITAAGVPAWRLWFEQLLDQYTRNTHN